MNKKTIKGLIIAGVTGVGAVATYFAAKKIKEINEMKAKVNVSNDNNEENREEMNDLFAKIRAERGWNTEPISEGCQCSGSCDNCTCHEEEIYADGEIEDDFYNEEEDEVDTHTFVEKLKDKIQFALNNSADLEDLKCFLPRIEHLASELGDSEEEDLIKEIVSDAKDLVEVLEEKELSTLEEIYSSEDEDLIDRVKGIIEVVESLD